MHVDGSVCILYVDEFILAATLERAQHHWKELGVAAEFCDEAAPILR